MKSTENQTGGNVVKTPLKPFLMVNPKSYLYGERSLDLAKAADQTVKETGLTIYFTCPYPDIRMIAEQTEHIIVTAQSMMPLKPGRGMGHLLPEAIKVAGAGAVVLNHAENPLTFHDLYENIKRAEELEMFSIVCADSVAEAEVLAMMHPDAILAEPTELIGTGVTADDSYIDGCVSRIKAVDNHVAVMIGSGISTADDCYNVIIRGGDATGATSGILNAPDPKVRIREMAEAMCRGLKETGRTV